MRDVSLLIELADGTRRIGAAFDERGRFMNAGVEPACMLRVRCWSADDREGGRAASGCRDWRLDARDGERRTLGTAGIAGLNSDRRTGVARSLLMADEGRPVGVLDRPVGSPILLV